VVAINSVFWVIGQKVANYVTITFIEMVTGAKKAKWTSKMFLALTDE
jgi:hypothetical protein